MILSPKRLSVLVGSAFLLLSSCRNIEEATIENLQEKSTLTEYQMISLAGRRDDALRIAATLEKNPEPLTTWGLAEIYAALGDKDNAFRWLEESYNCRFSWIPWIKQVPTLRSLHDDPRFQEMERRLDVPN